MATVSNQSRGCHSGHDTLSAATAGEVLKGMFLFYIFFDTSYYTFFYMLTSGFTYIQRRIGGEADMDL